MEQQLARLVGKKGEEDGGGDSLPLHHQDSCSASPWPHMVIGSLRTEGDLGAAGGPRDAAYRPTVVWICPDARQPLPQLWAGLKKPWTRQPPAARMGDWSSWVTHATGFISSCSDRPHRRTALVAAELSRYNIDIAALSETRILDEGSLTEEGMGYTFFWKGYPSGGQHLHGNRFATLLSAYAPTLPSESEAKDSFYQSLDEALRRIPKNDKIFFVGKYKGLLGSCRMSADGLTVLKDQHSILLRWAEHFGTLLNQDSDADPTVLDDLPTLPPMHNLDQPPTFLELLHKEIEDSSGVAVDFRLDGNLFNIRRLQATTKLQRERVIELQYADDCALLSHSPQDLQSVLTAVVRAYSRMGLTVNTIKTEVVCQWSANIPSTPPTFTAAGEQLSVVPSFRYLGSILSEDNTIDNEVQNRIKQASAAFGRLRRRVFQNKNLHLRTKVCVYQAICITTLLYSCDAWVTYSRHIRALEQFHIRCLQRILGITWRDRVPLSEVLSKTNCRSIEATITQHQLRWLGHVVRMPSNLLPRRVLYGQLHHALLEGRRSAIKTS
ncbi:hypothetical protein JOQ06_019036 [Pogonophryne albipinna]|uniref:Reverse transcriptase domain-containing protein n=1 Tax=Pogonophryne albipinna TaxID=1090488 RepID=A0AAD6AQK4_9TELE|nr:hypothetical protein JOQ06_019036 [Pogonophryne albipinna]